MERRHAVTALRAVQALNSEITPLLHLSEVRTIAADDLWLSPSCGRDSVSFQFTWKYDIEGVTSMLPRLEAALEPFGARPHWGKLFVMGREKLAGLYPNVAEFVKLANKLDPDGKFRNRFLSGCIFGSL
jgi:xylitol oxidase